MHIRDASGHNVPDVRLTLDGPSQGEFTTDAEGVLRLRSIHDGAYTMRLAKSGFEPVERKLQIRDGQPDVIEVALSRTPPTSPAAPPGIDKLVKLVPPPPVEKPAPARSETPIEKPTPSVEKAAPPSEGDRAVHSSEPVDRTDHPAPTATNERATVVSIPDFVDKNFVGRARMKQSVVGCTGSVTTRVIQLRENLAEHVHDEDDETLYVVAGEGVLIIPGREDALLSPGSFSIVPVSIAHSIERHGKNPLVIVSTLTGSPCAAPTAAPK